MAWALVTGASAGLGAEFARQLAARGDDVVVVARGAERLEALADEIRALGRQSEVIVADLGRAGDRATVAARIASPDRPVATVVNNAGYGFNARFTRLSSDELDAGLGVMVAAVQEFSHAAAVAMSARGAGAIINVGSIAGTLARGVYSAHKAWVQVFTEGLASELRASGVRATVLCAGLVRTEFHERARLDFSRLPRAVWLDAPRVVAATLRASDRGRVIVVPSARYKVGTAVARHLPRWLSRRV